MQIDENMLAAMTEEILRAEPIHRPSNFWTAINRLNLEMLSSSGIDNFKRTLAQNYFNWLVARPYNIQFLSTLRAWLRSPSVRPFTASMETPKELRSTIGYERRIGRIGFWFYKIFVAMLWEYTARVDRSGLSRVLQEPTIGNPIKIVSNGRLISQDLANSIREYNTVTTHGKCSTVAELGAGYGRLAHVFLSAGSRYFIFDIPPALHVAQWYLTHLFPEKKAFRFRHIDRFSDVAGEIGNSDFGFFTSNQLGLFPDKFFDCTLSISTLPEMTRAQIGHYLGELSRLSGKWVYLKQWTNWVNKADGYEVNAQTFALSPDQWKLSIDRRDAIHPRFCEKLWHRRQDSSLQNRTPA